MAKVIYRVLDSHDNHVTFLDEYEIKGGTAEEVAAYWRNLIHLAKIKGLYISDGLNANGVFWLKAHTKGYSSIRKYELHDNSFNC